MASSSSACFLFMPAAGDLMRAMSLATSFRSFCRSMALAFFCRSWRNGACRFPLISSILCMAPSVCCHSSLLYLTGTLRRFSNSKEGSTASSFPALLRKALVHLALRGFFFFLKFLWHFDLQKLKILQSLRTNLTPLPGYTLDPQK